MRRRNLLVVALSLIFYLLGLLQPSAILLDMPFGLAFYVADLLGKWHQGPLWVINNRFLAIFCGLIWPLLVSLLLSYVAVYIASKIWNEGKRRSRLYAVIFIIALFGLILSVRVRPAYFYISYFGYWSANY